MSRLSLRTKLIASFLFVVVAGGLLSSLIGTRLVADTIVSQARTKVRYDLNTAGLIYGQALSRIQDVVQLTAAGRTPPDMIEARQWKVLEDFLIKRRKDFGLDILTLTDARGKVLVRTHHPFQTGDDQGADPLVQRALKGESVASTVIVPREELEKEKHDLAERAFIPFVPTPRAREVPAQNETAGMMLKAASPIWDRNGRLVGVLYGGILLNRNYQIVDKVRDILYGEGRYKGKEMGTATIFQGDLRVSTNVLDEKGQRAIGTRVSEEVYRAVLEKGESWLDRAFVVHDWYLTGYQPIRDLTGKVVGILYVGMLEAPYVDLRNKVVYSFFAIGVLGVAIVLLLYFFITSRITRPLREMAAATAKIAEGDLSVEVAGQSEDEIGTLAKSFNHMLVRLKQARKELEDYGRLLEQKVEERTRELVQMQDQLIQSEKLASMGQLSASIAHEVNNPLSGALIYNQLIAKKITRGDFDREAILNYLSKMEHELSRSTKLIRSLLDFAVQTEPKIKEVNVNDVLNRALELGIHAGSKENTRVEKDLQALPTFMVDPDQLEQVFVNLIMNALQAMPQGGTLTLRTYLENRELKIAVQDTGCGIPPENMNKIFTPFFSTKKEVKGVGLGLSVSYGIIQGLKGRIEVESKVGEGTTFIVCLPVSQE
ncbi:MAG: cache domain-containing protein [Syntrophaceae bacterium]|nr:cache domain-containing protein [Syntrophaceae bacterium]